jgi:hypothetical protein
MYEVEPKKVGHFHIRVEYERYLQFSEMSVVRTELVRYAVTNMENSSSNVA